MTKSKTTASEIWLNHTVLGLLRSPNMIFGTKWLLWRNLKINTTSQWEDGKQELNVWGYTHLYPLQVDDWVTLDICEETNTRVRNKADSALPRVKIFTYHLLSDVVNQFPLFSFSVFWEMWLTKASVLFYLLLHSFMKVLAESEQIGEQKWTLHSAVFIFSHILTFQLIHIGYIEMRMRKNKYTILFRCNIIEKKRSHRAMFVVSVQSGLWQINKSCLNNWS